MEFVKPIALSIITFPQLSGCNNLFFRSSKNLSMSTFK